MKVLLVNTFYTPDVYGGAEISIQKLAEELVKNYIDVTVLATSNIAKREKLNGVNVIRIKTNNLYDTIKVKNQGGITKGLYKVIDLYNIFNYNKFYKIIEEINPDVIHTNNMYGISPIIWSIANKKNIKVVHTVRDYNLICPFVHYSCENDKCKYTSICKLYRKFEIKNCNIVNTSIFISQTVKKIFNCNKYFRNSQQEVIYNAIDFDLESLQKIIDYKLKVNKKEVNFVYIGTLDFHKGIDLLINAFNELKMINFRLHIAGKGPLENMVKEASVTNENIIFHGFINQNCINTFLEKQDVLIAPSRWVEPFGRVVIDAYKNGLPVIASNNGGFKETVVNEVTGLLYENNNKEKLKEAIVSLGNLDVRKKYISNIKDEIIKYDLKNHAKEYMRTYMKH